MKNPTIHSFGLVDESSDAFEFNIELGIHGTCKLVAVLQTERGPRRTDIASICSKLWNSIADRTIKVLAAEMAENERGKSAPTLLPGKNRISPLIGRELGVLLIVLMEEGASDRLDSLLHAWRELAREERWWLYAKAAAPGQRAGQGWRKALFYALSETSETQLTPESQKLPKGKRTTPSESEQIGKERAQASKTSRAKRNSVRTPDDGQMRLFQT